MKLRHARTILFHGLRGVGEALCGSKSRNAVDDDKVDCTACLTELRLRPPAGYVPPPRQVAPLCSVGGCRSGRLSGSEFCDQGPSHRLPPADGETGA